MKVTIKQIAELAGVSISTVSRVINNSKPVRDDVRKRVLEAMKETNYKPSMLESELFKAESSMIGVIIPEYSNTVLNDFIAGINNVTKLYGYDIMIGLTDETPASELHYLNQFCGIQPRGLIFAGSPLTDEHTAILDEYGIPCVVVGQVSGRPHIPSVHVDNITASYEAVTYLISRGHREIGMIRGIGAGAVGDDRYEGYVQALTDAGLPLREDWVVESDLSVEDGTKAMSRMAGKGPLPTAVFCATDWMAIGAMNGLIDRGLRVPEDVSVFGFDGSFISSIVRPRLSTVVYSATEIGMTATRSLVKMIKGDNAIPQHSNVNHYLAIRESTR
ncbi:LacI family DNA-binding transcriptional regulator [Paenibacillus sp. YYML68]|uniref:LacI family DNA-binding transcriptional regulator n=1 Tax=Paenibacillus sp. YYML68 TaxID=2909250 RepID=UPI002490EDCF|nr:LacI family DNA-binding transcriptional regulator [Paenibacillus sp. YYML68]